MKLEINSKLFSSTLLYVGTDIINKAMPFLILPIITKYLSPAEFGIVSNYILLITVFVLLIGLSSDGAISADFYKLSKIRLKAYISNASQIIALTTLILFLIISVGYNYLFSFTSVPYKFQAIALISAMFQIFSSINLTIWRLEGHSFSFGLFQICQTALNVIISLIFIILLQKGWEGRADGYSYSIIIFGIISLIILYRKDYLSIVKPNKYYIYKLLLFGVPLIPHTVGIWIRTGVDRFLINKFVGEYAVGVFSTSIQFGLFFSFISVAFNNAFIPYLFKNLSSKKEANSLVVDKNIVHLTYKVGLAYVILSVLLIFVSNFAINFLLPASYSESVEYIPYVIITQMFQGFYMLIGNYIFYAKKTKPLAIISISIAIFHVILCYFLVINFQTIGAGYAAVISAFINFVAVWWLSNRVYPMPWFKFEVWK